MYGNGHWFLNRKNQAAELLRDLGTLHGTRLFAPGGAPEECLGMTAKSIETAPTSLKRKIRGLVSLILIATAVFYAVWNTGWRGFDATSMPIIFAAAGFLFISNFIAAVRMQAAMRDLGHRIGYRDCLRTVVLGAVGGFLAFQLFGQLALRSAVLRRVGFTAETATAVTIYERIVAAAVSLLMACAGAIYLFGSVRIDLKSGGADLSKVAIGIVTVVIAVSAFAWRDLLIKSVLPLIHVKQVAQIARLAGLTILVQLCTLAAFVLLISGVKPDESTASITAAATIVMFAASVPISFSGWGVREISSIAALGYIGIEPKQALSASVLIGLLSLLSVGVLSLWAGIGLSSVPPSQSREVVSNRAVEVALSLITAMLVVIQIKVPLADGPALISPADLTSCVVGILVLFELGQHSEKLLTPITVFIALWSVALVESVLHGIIAFGPTVWATKKALGWLVLLSYAAVGWVLSRKSNHLTATVCVATSAAIFVGFLSPGWRLEGLAENPNAFAFQILIAMCLAMTGLSRVHSAQFGVVGVGAIIATKSLAGIGTLCALVPISAVILGPRQYRNRLIAAFVVAAIALITVVFAIDPRPLYGIASSNAERLQSIREGLATFWSHPIFGAGLGFFYATERSEIGLPVVIHSVPIWILAEFGLTGFCISAAAIYNGFRLRIPLLTLILSVFVIFGQAHDIAYQRIFWLAVGAALAQKPQQYGSIA
jgi:uncharacterized membrane protein YbhN (UPF0104 family)